VIALENCTRPFAKSQCYIQFVSAARPNLPGSELQFEKCVELGSDEEAIVLDLLKDGRIGGIEFKWLMPHY